MADVLLDLTSLDTWSRYSGTGRYVHELGRALQALSPAERQGLSIEGLTGFDINDTTGDLGWPGGDAPLDESQEMRWLNQRRTRLAWTLARLRPSLLHAPYQLGTPRGSLVPRVVTCLDLIRLVLKHQYMAGRPGYVALTYALEAARFHSARRVIAISRHTADDLVRVLRVPAAKIDVAHLGVDLELYRPPADEAEAARYAAVRQRLELTDGGYIFYMGRADPRKNVDVLVAAFARAAVQDLQLVIIGKMRGADRRAFDEAMEAAGHPAGVRFVGFLDEAELPAVICGALAFVFCSTYEGFGNVPVEAMGCGCPVVSTACTSLAETVVDAALVVPPRDVDATADAIRRIATEPGLPEQLRQASLRRAQRFTWRNTALCTVESYARALYR